MSDFYQELRGCLEHDDVAYVKSLLQNVEKPEDYASLLPDACQINSPKIAVFLLECNVNPNTIDRYGRSGLHYAAYNGNITLVTKLLANKADIHLKDYKTGQTPLLYAAEHVQFNQKMLNLLLNHHADPSVQDNRGNNTLHYLCRRSEADKGFEMIKLLVEEKGISVNIENTHEETPLFYAAANNAITITSYLLEKGANINKRSKNTEYSGETPLHNAVNRSQNEMISLLLKSGANSNIVDYKGRIPIECTKDEEIRKLLLAYK